LLKIRVFEDPERSLKHKWLFDTFEGNANFRSLLIKEDPQFYCVPSFSLLLSHLRCVSVSLTDPVLNLREVATRQNLVHILQSLRPGGFIIIPASTFGINGESLIEVLKHLFDISEYTGKSIRFATIIGGFSFPYRREVTEKSIAFMSTKDEVTIDRITYDDTVLRTKYLRITLKPSWKRLYGPKFAEKH
jgi:hypothetical protein